ncbi:ABC transporter permease [Paraliomyxa miuraensis]|uniref:ABC transporter permease n=1 Tax=Paraliomyxa miuraensis TaxID=376150 RepID=UPI00224DC081|nr:ABC transporter permease [Paraliomyxa miuraensis]MCX4242933.1 ABC transporter permease [Paraliomyxa miuraensis]
MRVVLIMALKDLRLLVRDRMSLFWVLAFPLLLALFFGSLFGGDSGERAAMPVVVVDESGGEGARLVERLRSSEGLEIDTVDALDDALELVRRGKRIAFVHIRPGFTDGGFAMFGRDPKASATLALGVDPARTAERGLLQGLVTQALFSGMTEQFADPSRMLAQTQQVRKDLDDATELESKQRERLLTLMDALDGLNAADGPLAGDRTSTDAEASRSGFSLEGLLEAVDVTRDDSGQPRSAFDITFPSSIVWGLMGCATAFATSMVHERRAGTLLRLRVAPIARAHVLASKGLACMLAGMGTSALLLTFGVLALGVRVGDPLLLLLALVCASACFTGIMLVMSVIGRTEAAVSGGSWVVMMPLAMIGGGMIPLIAMPPWLLAASHASPFRWAILAIEGAVWRDLSLTQMLPSLSILLALAVVLFGIGVAVMRRRDP